MYYKNLLKFRVVFLAVGLAIFMAPFAAGKVNAAPASGDWISQTQISYNNQVFTDNRIDDTWEFHSDDNRSCDNIIHDFDGGETGGSGSVKEANPTGGYYLARSKDPATGACKPSSSTRGVHITLNQVTNSKMDFVWQDGSTIQGVTGSTFVQKDGGAIFYEQGGDKCKDTLEIQSTTSAKLIVRTGGDRTAYDNSNLWIYNDLFANNSTSQDGCTVYGPVTVGVSDYNSASQKNAASSTSSTDASGTTSSGPDVNCGGLSLNWILCPFEEGLTTAVRGIDAVISGLLQIDTNSIFSDCSASTSTNCATSAAYKSAWSGMRTIALALLVIAALVMIISQALGFDFVDAYTIRKVLPRLLAAAIGITLSWQLLQFFVTFTNDLGLGVRSLIYAPFSGLTQSIQLGNAGGLFGIILAGIGAVFLGWGMLSFLATALLAVLIAVLVLIIRQVLIIFLILVAPLAIVSYILPNTKKMYDVWWDFFAKALLMFPFIMAFIAVGRVFATVAATNAKTASFPLSAIDGILAFVAYFAPYFLLPLTFRFAGGALRNIGGFVNDRGRGGFDRLRKYRANTAAERFKRAQSQSLWDNNSRIGRQANKLASWGTSPVANTAYYGRNIPGLRKRGLGVASAIEQARVEQSSKLFEELNKMGYNDKAYRLLSGQHSDLSQETRDKLHAKGLLGKAPTSIPDLQTMAGIMAESTTSDSERIGAQAINGSIGRLATLYQDPEMTKASTQAAGILGLAAHGFASGEDLAGAGNALSNEGKDLGFAQSIVSQAQLLGQRSRPDTKPGYGVTIKGGEFVNGVSAEGGRADAVLDTLSAQDLAGAKGGAIEALKPTIYDRITGPERAAQSNLSPEEKAKIKAKADAQKDQLYQWASPYSQASNDVKVRALQMIDELGLRQEFDETVNMRNLTPEQRAEMMRRTGQRPDEGNPTPGQGM